MLESISNFFSKNGWLIIYSFDDIKIHIFITQMLKLSSFFVNDVFNSWNIAMENTIMGGSPYTYCVWLL